MEDLRKVSSLRLYLMLKNLSIGLLALLASMALSKMLPQYLSPIINLIFAAALYQYLVAARTRNKDACLLVPYVILICIISYTFTSIILNILVAWHLLKLPEEFVFLTYPYIPSLLMLPMSFVIVVVAYFRLNKLKLCENCRIKNGDVFVRGRMGAIINNEAKFQLKNLMLVFGMLSVIIWAYYLIFYININSNARDWYMFTWLVVISFLLDEFYILFRFYNLYLDLKENDVLLDEKPDGSLDAKTYVRVYVICDNEIYVDTHAIDPMQPYHDVIDTPFFYTVNGTNEKPENVYRYISEKTGVKDGELRFFFSRNSSDIANHKIVRYFYFLDGKSAECPVLKMEGEWMDFKQLTSIYSMSPRKLSHITYSDITRLATIILTEKIFDAKGNRKSKIRNYKPSFNLVDVRRSVLDFQDDKWVRISMFNSDMKFFHLRSWIRKISGRDNTNQISWPLM